MIGLSSVNRFNVPVMSTNEVLPIAGTIDQLDAAEENQVVSAKRYDLSDSQDTGTDVSSEATMSANILTVANLWLQSDAPAAGKYAVQLIVGNPDNSIKVEINLIYTIV